MFKTIASLLFASLTAVALGGCPAADGPDPIVTDWTSRDPVGGYFNTLEIDDDLEGEATVYYYASDGYLYYADFDVEVEPGDGGYEMQFDCSGDCAYLDFEMDCEMGSEDDELDCDADGNWSAYIFEWKVD